MNNTRDLLNDLNNRKITGYEAIGTVRHFIEKKNSEYEDFMKINIKLKIYIICSIPFLILISLLSL